MEKLTSILVMPSATLDWRRAMRWKMATLMCAKLALLTLLWALFFSPSHRIAVDSAATSDRFGVALSRKSDVSGGLPRAINTRTEN